MITYEDVLQSDDIEDFLYKLHSFDCRRCSLSQHDNRVVVYRGNPGAKIMLIGEAPGLVEDQQGLTFVGPAGILCDNIFRAVGIDTNTDMYLGNICKCRPVAPRGSGKQNYTPLADQKRNCMPYIRREIELINPELIVLAGLTAAKAILGWDNKVRMGDVAGNSFEKDRRQYFVIYHPAYVIHAQKSGPAAASEARQKMWEHIQSLRETIDALGIELSGQEYECKFCHTTFVSNSPYTHQSGFVCENCWDERLRPTM